MQASALWEMAGEAGAPLTQTHPHLVICLLLRPQWSDTTSLATVDTVCMVGVSVLIATLRLWGKERENKS